MIEQIFSSIKQKLSLSFMVLRGGLCEAVLKIYHSP